MLVLMFIAGLVIGISQGQDAGYRRGIYDSQYPDNDEFNPDTIEL